MPASTTYTIPDNAADLAAAVDDLLARKPHLASRRADR
jgi:hypothetical protein